MLRSIKAIAQDAGARFRFAMRADIPLDTLGRIVQGDELGRFVEVKDDTDRTGGFLIFTYGNTKRGPEVFDAWVETRSQLQSYFEESGWRVEWLSV